MELNLVLGLNIDMKTSNKFRKRSETLWMFRLRISIFFLCYSWNVLPMYSQFNALKNKNEIRVGIFQILLDKTIITNYERFYKNFGTSVTLATSYNHSYYKPYLPSQFIPYKGFLLQIDQKMYLKNQSTDYGIFYLSPGFKYRYKLITRANYDYGVSTYYKGRIKTFGVQIVAGIKYIILETFVIDFHFGGAIYKSIIQIEGTQYVSDYSRNYFSPGYSGVAPVISCTFGFKF